MTLQRPTTWTPSATDPHDVPIHTYVRVRQTIYVHPEFEARILPSPVSTTGGPHDFSDHIGTLDQWMQQLLSNVQWVCPYAQVLNTLQTLSPELPLFVVSDGSSLENQHMSFGVTIGLPNGDILVELSGSASGPPSSHRAECTGCLAGAVFCRELFRFSERSFPALSICAASDNQAMIKSLTERMSYDKVYPNSTLRPDWDLLEEIIAVYRHTGAHQVKFEWVKGHQDSSTTQIHELPPQALFNIRSDTLATEIRQSHGLTMLSLSPLLSTTRCHLVVNGTTITGKYRSTLRVLASETQYFEYLTKRHHWDSHIVDTIDWEAFCMAARTYSSTEVHLLKLVHDKLPMRRLVSRHQPWTNDRCHYCSAHDTMDHLQTGICNPVSPKFRRTLLKSIRHYLSGRNCPLEFTHRFLDTVTTWLDPPHHSLHPQHPEQNTIGLRLITRGFLSQQWRQDLSDSMLRNSQSAQVPTSHELTSTLAGLIKTMWSGLGQAWLDHLNTIHATDKTPQSPVTLASLRDRIRLIYALKPNTLPIHAHFFHPDLEDFLAKGTIQSFTSYITHYLPAILHSVAAARSLDTTPPINNSTPPPRQCPNPQRNPIPVNPPAAPLTERPDLVTPHPAMEEPPHRKRARRRTFHRVLWSLLLWARRRRDPPNPS